MALRLDSRVPAPVETHVTIGALRRRHLRQVLRIENKVYPRPWTLGVFTSELSQSDARCYLVARVGSMVVGYCGALYSMSDAHVTNIAVDPRWHRHCIGSRLLMALVDESVERGASHLTLEVRVSNHGAQEMYRKFGLAPAGVRAKYYENTEDAIVMWANDIDAAPYRERMRAVGASIPGTTAFDSPVGSRSR
jgi:[ribosomal protein S18]-alanine N-acetyltransferase